MSQTILSTAYFAPIQYYCKLVQHNSVLIEQWENYCKQSYRNRCNIMGANGVLPLSVPVVKATNKKVLTKDVKISYDTNWQKLHWKGIESAYKSSPYYEYYVDDLEQFFYQKWNYLMDFNQEIQNCICDILEIEAKTELSNDYIDMNTADIIDYRNSIHPKASKSTVDTQFKAQEYTQVFSDKHAFAPNLSILDLIFNLGPEGESYLQSCIME